MTNSDSNNLLGRHDTRRRGDIRPGADRLQTLLGRHLDTGILERPALLVTGTNGKGSVCAMLESVLRAHGLTTGLYTSPHLRDVNERIRLNGIPASTEFLAPCVRTVEQDLESALPDATFFEIATATALHAFQQAQVDVSVVEIGLGGRLDSTNSIAPTVSVLTGVGLDHVRELGNSLAGIARDKAAIARRSRPFVVAPLAAEALPGLLETTGIIGPRLVHTDQGLPASLEAVLHDLPHARSPWLRLNPGHARTALHALAAFAQESSLVLVPDKVAAGLENTVWPGRFDLRIARGGRFLFDACHNPCGFDFFRAQLRQSTLADERFVVLYGSFADKDWQAVVPGLADLASEVIFTQVESERAAPADLLQAAFGADVPSHSIPQLSRAVSHALAISAGRPILVLGSIMVVGDVMADLQISPYGRTAADNWDMRGS